MYVLRMLICTFVILLSNLCSLAVTAVVHAQNISQSNAGVPLEKSPAYDVSVPEPTFAGVRYGEHERQIFDFWQAPSDKLTPLVFVIHGGGWFQGSKEGVNRIVDVATLLKAGISVVSINYRLIDRSIGDGNQVTPPVKAPLHDAARALQYVRSKAREWKIEKERICASGYSAGGTSSLWLAYHDDLANLQSEDPVARESTRLWCVAVAGAQTTLDPKLMKEWTPNSVYGGHAFGKKDFAQFLAERESILPWIVEYSPYALIGADDPPTYLLYSTVPSIGQIEEKPTHTTNFGAKLKERCVELGVDCKLVYSEAPDARETVTYYLVTTLNF